MKKYWLMKTEPSVFSFQDLLKQKNKSTFWEGVRNYQARNLMRDEMKIGDEALIYHSGIDEPEILGIAVISQLATEDKTAMDKKNKYFDADAFKKNKNPWVGVTIQAFKTFKKPVTRTHLKEEPRLKDMMVLKKGARLSVQPVSEKEFRTICQLGLPTSLD